MSRSKEATVVLLDAGSSMSTCLREKMQQSSKMKIDSESKQLNTRFDAAVAAIESLIQQKLFFKPKDEIGIVLFGTPGTDNQLNTEQGEGEYSNVTVVSQIDTPTLNVYEKIRTFKPTQDPTVKVDLLDGLIVALDLIYRRTEGKKYDKHLLVLTDASSKIQDSSDIESVVQMIHNMGVHLQIVGIDFDHTTEKRVELDPNAMKDEPTIEPISSIKIENERMLVSIAHEVNGEVSSASKRMQLLTQGMKKSVGQVTIFRGPLEIGNELRIPLYCYLTTKVATLPTLVKESQVSVEKEELGRVHLDRRYTSPQNPDEEVPPHQQVKSYRYGMERVPFSSADVEFFKFQTEKSLKLLGFVDKEQLNWASFISGTNIFAAEPNIPRAAQALAALVEGMHELNQVAIARFVRQKNAAPKILALIPHAPSKTNNYYCLWGQQLPYDEDVRHYEFMPIKVKKYTPSDIQADLADKLVESLSVREDKAEQVGASFNPILRRFYEAVDERAFDSNASVPPVPLYVESCLNMDEARRFRIQGIIQDFGSAFQLKEAVKNQSERKKKAFWSDVQVTGIKTEEGTDVKEEIEEMDNDSDIDLDDLLDSGEVTSVGSMNPIADFESLVETGKSSKQRLLTAVTGMKHHITTFFTSGESFHAKALQCLVHFRKRSAEIHYSSEFNEFLTQLKTIVCEDSSSWRTIKQDGITLLSEEDDPSLSITLKQARSFLYGDEEVDLQLASASLSSQVEDMDKDDDMFADFE